MSFASFILKKVYSEDTKVEKTMARQVQHSAAPNVPESYVKTARGAMRIAKNGKIDGRSLQRGKPKNWDRKPRGVRAYEHILLRDILDGAKPGEEFSWKWRTSKTYEDPRLRNAQLTYAYKIANVYGHKVSLSSKKAHIVIRYVGKSNAN